MSKQETAVAWKQNLVRGDVIRVAIPSDIKNNRQKNRSAIVLENKNDNNSLIPTLVVQSLSLLSNWDHEKKIITNWVLLIEMKKHFMYKPMILEKLVMK